MVTVYILYIFFSKKMYLGDGDGVYFVDSFVKGSSRSLFKRLCT